MKSHDELARELKEKNIRLSHQRLKILEYLAEHAVHPTAEQIYIGLRGELATLSRTTVYSTLNALAAAGMVRAVNIEGNEVRYDARTCDHGHFKCESCGEIFDFAADLDALPAAELKDFMIRDRDVYFKGLCPSCLAARH
jgi:Fe2+ or Zn2+ uptake regulation protein